MDPGADDNEEIGLATEIAKITNSGMDQPAQMDPPSPPNHGSRELKTGTAPTLRACVTSMTAAVLDLMTH